MRTQRTRGSSVPTDKLPRPGRQHGYAPEVGMIDRSGDPIVAGKIARLSDSSYRLKVLDLFAGCGGLSLGFDAAGYQITAAVELDDLASRSHALNFCRGKPEEDVETHAKPRDITRVDPEELVEDLGLGDAAAAFDVIIGG